MRDQTQPWGDRTAGLPPQDPWAVPPTTEIRPDPAEPAPTMRQPEQAASASPFQRGVAHVHTGPRTEQFTSTHEPTGTGWPGAEAHAERQPLQWHARQLRKGLGWSLIGATFAFVCWGIWAVSSGGDLLSPLVVFLLILAVSAGVFALSRLIGRVVLERYLHRLRRSARGAHLVTGLFLLAVGVGYLRQTSWVVDAWNWVVGLF